MCGLAGAVGADGVEKFVRAANILQAHRGPDVSDWQVETCAGRNVGFSHQRLSIFDLSDAGRQPMTSRSGRLTIVYNGEIYNYRELANEFGLEDLRSSSDTEVALEIIERIGLEAATRKFNGMWAIALLDREEGKLWLSRDRFGKKPLYWSLHRGTFYFASELKSFLAIEGADWRVDPVTASHFLRQSLQDIDERSWLKGVQHFPASSCGWVDVSMPENGLQGLQHFWRPNLEPVPVENDDSFISELRNIVTDSIDLRLRSDRPVGVAVSGGIDSSIIASVTNAGGVASGRPIQMFSAVNPESSEDESEYVEILRKHLDCDVSLFSLARDSNEDLHELMTTCAWHNDGPLTSFSNLLFYKLMEKARALDITVVLTGQGADEAFCGYRKYPMFELQRRLRKGELGGFAKMLAGFVARGTMLPQFNFSEAKRYLGVSNDSILGEATAAVMNRSSIGMTQSGIAERQWLDIAHFSVPYLTHYEDRMSMAWSREVRAPFLDYRVVEMGLRAPTDLKMKAGWSKYALRRAFEDDLPPEIIWRKDKKGFVNPQDDWLRTDLRDHVLAMIDNPTSPVFAQGLVDREAYTRMFGRYCQGEKGIWFRDVFAPFSLNLWMVTFFERAVSGREQVAIAG